METIALQSCGLRLLLLLGMDAKQGGDRALIQSNCQYKITVTLIRRL